MPISPDPKILSDRGRSIIPLRLNALLIQILAVLNALTASAPTIADQSGGVNALRYVTPSQWGAILAGTSTYDVTANLQSALTANRDVFMPRGRWLISSSLTLPRGHSLRCSPGANVVADFTKPGTWGGTFIALQLNGLGGVNVDSDTHCATVENLVVTSVNAVAVVATAVNAPNGPTPAVGDSLYQFTMRNIMVVGFDTAYYFGQVRESEMWGIKSRDCRRGVVVTGRNVGVRFFGINLYGGAWAANTASALPSVGVLIDYWFRPGTPPTPERCEDINFNLGGVVDFNTCFACENSLLCKVWGVTFDSGGGGGTEVVVIGANEEVVIEKCWIASQNGSVGILCRPFPTADVPRLAILEGNEFDHCSTGIKATDRDHLRIVANSFRFGTGRDIDLTGVLQSEIRGNRSKDGTGTVSIYLNAVVDVDIDDNTTTLAVPLYVHPTNSTTVPVPALPTLPNASVSTSQSLRIGKNIGATHTTYETGNLLIPAGATSAVLTLTKWSTMSYVLPRVRVLATAKNVGFVNVLETAQFTTFTLSIGAAAPAGGVLVRYAVEGIWYGDA